jgi:hypothetical protein
MKSALSACLLALATAACGNDSTIVNTPDGGPTPDVAVADAPPGAPDADTGCNPITDFDGDGIPSGLEGCQETPPRDTDFDGMPDWLDTDGDNDGLDDRYEDRNHDGVLGTCTVVCTDASMCTATEICSPALGVCVGTVCADGETSPLSGDTDLDGVLDGVEGTRICNPASEENPEGLKPYKTTDSAVAIIGSTPNWEIALESAALEGVVTIDSPQAQDSAYLFDLDDPNIEVAGFLVSRAAVPGDGSAVGASQNATELFTPLGISGITSSGVRSAGLRNTSLDGYDTVLGAQVEVNTSGSISDVTVLRQKVMTALSMKPASALTFPPVSWTGGTTNQYMVIFQTLFRPDRSQVIYMGAVVARADYDDRARATPYHADDLAYGTQLTVSGNGEEAECEGFEVAEGPRADIIWALDTSGSMSDDLAEIATNSTTLFNYAVAAGLNFRMGVTDMNQGRGGIFAARMSGTSTGDRWLGPTELTTFQANIQNPSGGDVDLGGEYGPTQGQAAVTRHLPRDNADPSHIREDAELVVILVSDEKPQEIEDADIFFDGDTPATTVQLSDTLSELKPYIDTWQENDAIVHAIVVPEPYPACSGGGGEVGWGYHGIVSWFGGVLGSICLSDLGPSMQAIVDEILGTASPIVLEWVPIAATISVTRNGTVIPRSRDTGWDYNASANSIVFFNLPFDPDNPSEVIVSYRRWAEQVPID